MTTEEIRLNDLLEAERLINAEWKAYKNSINATLVDAYIGNNVALYILQTFKERLRLPTDAQREFNNYLNAGIELMIASISATEAKSDVLKSGHRALRASINQTLKHYNIKE